MVSQTSERKIKREKFLFKYRFLLFFVVLFLDVTMSNKLVKIERHDWPALRDLFAPNSPTTFVPHNLVDNFIRWTDEQPDFPSLIFYSLNGDWSDGTFTAIVSLSDQYPFRTEIHRCIVGI